MGELRFFIIQFDPRVHPPLSDGRFGVLHPVNMDGFYLAKSEAQGVAEYMAEERPDLITCLGEAVDLLDKPRIAR